MGCTPARSERVIKKKYASPKKIKDIIESEIVGSTIALKYEFIRLLGEGGMGKTYLCKDRSGDQYAVQKIMRGRLGNENCKELCKNFSLLQNLECPYLVKYYELYEESSCIFLVMEYCSGGDLFDRLFSSSKFSESQSSKIIFMILCALDYLQQNCIVHCDIKPQNIMFATTEDNSIIKIIDFNLCKFAKEGTDECPNGTPQYLAPEIIEGRFSTASDMWSLGIIMHIFLSGEYPFWGDTHKVLFNKIREGNLELEDSLWSNISQDAKDLLKKMMCVDDKKRILPKQALAHSWFKTSLKSKNRIISKEVKKNFSNLNQYYKLHKALKKIISQNQWEESLPKIKEIMVSDDGSQKILLKVKDLEGILHQLNKKATLDQIHSVLKQYNKHDSDKLYIYHMLNSSQRTPLKEQIHSYGEIDLSRHSKD